MRELIAENLFRQQAIRSLTAAPMGRPIAQVPRPWRWLTLLLVVALLAVALLATNAEYSRKETARGWLVARDGVARIAHSAVATITAVSHKVGDAVEAGDTLLYLSEDSSLSDGTSKNNQLLAELHKIAQELDLQRSLLKEQLEFDSRSLEIQLVAIDDETHQLQKNVAEQRQRIRLANDKLHKLSLLAQGGAITQFDLLRQEEEVGRLRQAMNRLRQNQSTLRRERERIRGQLETMPVAVAGKVSVLRAERTRLSQQIAEIESRREVVLRAPISGTVATVAARVGNTAAVRQTLVTILPSEMQLVAEVYVPSRAIGFIRRGQPVRLKFDAFPPQKFGAFEGQVDQVSEFVLLPAEIPPTFAVSEATYRVRVAVPEVVIRTGIGESRLRPGMLLAAEIVLEKRNFVDWLMEPLRLRRWDAT